MRALWAAIAVAIFPLASCASGSTSSSSPASAPATTLATTTTTAAPALIPQDSPATAASTLLRAWTTGDRALAGRVATPSVVAALFGRAPAESSDRGCQDPVGGQASCAFGIDGGLVQVHTVTLAGGWVVDSIVFE